MNLETRYRINEPSVVNDIVDGELIIIHMETGAYFTTNATGTFIWDLIQQGGSVRQIAMSLLSVYEGDPMSISFEIAPFISSLADNNLIEPISDESAPPVLNVPTRDVKEPFTTPRLDVYRDMQNLLIIDPIHEVDKEIGWPAQNPSVP